jgi:eukaryotic-like serine/threonine-protein kinase
MKEKAMSATPRILEKYELQKLLGQGSTGEVWKGFNVETRQDVAIKLLHPDLIQNDPNFITLFMKEWEAIASLQHPNIVGVREVKVSRPSEASNETTPYIVMDYIEGQTTLAQIIQRTSRVGAFPPVADIVYLFTSIGAAVDYAHEHHIVHNNIKPTNILLDIKNTAHSKSGEPKLTDFGIAHLPGNKNNVSTLYISPEQVKGDEPNPRSDIYALGVILYEMCTGVLPFHGESNIAIMMHHLNTFPTSPMLINPNIPLALSEVILRAMAKDPKTRFASASLLARSIAEACSIEQLPQMTLNKTQAEEPLFYTSSGPLRVPNAQGRQATNGITSILGVSQALTDVSGTYPAIPGKESLTRRTGGGSTRPIPVPPHQDAKTSSTVGGNSGAHYFALPPSQTTDRLATPTPSMKLPATSVVSSAARPAGELKIRSKNFLSPLVLAITGLLLLLLVVGSLGASLFFRSAANVPAPKGAIGHVFFQDDALGQNDTLRIELQNIPDPPQGKGYVAWIQNTSGGPIPLGVLAVHNGTASLLYAGNVHHDNLMGVMQGVFVTVENAGNGAPGAPSLHTKIYQASFPVASFQSIQHILYKMPGLPIHSSPITGLFDTIKGMNDKAVSIADSVQVTQGYPLAERQAVRIIEMIDGTQFARSSGDLPAALPDMLSLPVGLLSSPTQPGYIDTLTGEVNKILQSAGDNAELRKHAQNVNNALTDLKDWIQKMRAYDVQILKAANLADPAVGNTALQLKQLAQDAYTGRTIPPNEGPNAAPGSAGAYQAYVECQYLATLDIEKVP